MKKSKPGATHGKKRKYTVGKPLHNKTPSSLRKHTVQLSREILRCLAKDVNKVSRILLAGFNKGHV